MPPTPAVPNLPRKVRKKLKRRARKAARREFRPSIQQARAQVGAVREQYAEELNSIEGATNIVDNALQEQLQQLRHSGLEGRYLRDAISELQSRRADLPTSEQFLKADVRSDRAAAVTDARLAVANAQTDRATQAAQNYNSLLKEEYEDKASRLQNQREARQDRKSGGEESGIPKEELSAAAHEIQRLFRLNPEIRKAIYSGGSVEREGENGETVSVDAKQLVAELEGLVRKAEGVGYGAAQAVIERLRRLGAGSGAIVNPAAAPNQIAGPIRPPR